MMRQELVARLTGPGIRLRRLRRLPLPARICSIALVLLCLVALLAPWIAPHDPLATGTPAQDNRVRLLCLRWRCRDGPGRLRHHRLGGGSSRAVRHVHPQ
ncbi:hypothetical protein ACIBSV_09710 [Embleya sp. NPDC050154]|uniref:hypothetical protein n=1 Tax=Embleya sp. NPDC050154 TaxID=3363988 RepID=UPI00378EE5BE